MPRRIFAYGTLEIPEVVEALLGRRPVGRPAVLPGFARFLVRGRPYPGIVARPGARTRGVLWEGLREQELRTLDAYEGSLYERRELTVRTGSARSLRAEAYVVPWERRGLLSREPWDTERFVALHLDEYVTWCAGNRAPRPAPVR